MRTWQIEVIWRSDKDVKNSVSSHYFEPEYNQIEKASIGFSLCRFYILCLDVANESFRLKPSWRNSINREKIDLWHNDHQLGITILKQDKCTDSFTNVSSKILLILAKSSLSICSSRSKENLSLISWDFSSSALESKAKLWRRLTSACNLKTVDSDQNNRYLSF